MDAVYLVLLAVLCAAAPGLVGGFIGPGKTQEHHGLAWGGACPASSPPPSVCASPAGAFLVNLALGRVR